MVGQITLFCHDPEDPRVKRLVEKLLGLGFASVELDPEVNRSFNVKFGSKNLAQAQVIARLVADMTQREVTDSVPWRDFYDDPEEEDPEGTHVFLLDALCPEDEDIYINFPVIPPAKPQYRTDMYGFKTCDDHWKGDKPLSLLW